MQFSPGLAGLEGRQTGFTYELNRMGRANCIKATSLINEWKEKLG